VPSASRWPLLLQTPRQDDRAEPYRPAATLLVTGDDPAAAANLTAGLLPQPNLRPAGLLSLQRYLEGFSADMGPEGGAVPAEFLSLLGLRLGTSSRIQAGLYLETALVGVRDGADASCTAQRPLRSKCQKNRSFSCL
jgi:hypothetical protein